ncbi:hypothetical protein [Bacillus smithii]|uniref:hypothetical protein n=1 Tax=Bacillus smithii TaxID=1479 RepID=UPI002E1D7A95|nr:hypothetical protein [Bacillus smithii]MED1456088.1 hypothetical protein [Bacillus smithii]
MSKRVKMLIPLILVILFCFLDIFYYWKAIVPAKKQIAALSSQMAHVNNSSEKVQSEKQLSADDLKKVYQWQTALPWNDSVDQFILDLQKAEASSGCTIIQYALAEDSDSSTDADDGTNQADQMDQMTGTNSNSNATSFNTGETTSTTAQNNDTKPSKTAKTSLPSGVKQEKVNLVVQASTYPEIYQFLKKLEQMDRVNRVESIQFVGNNEPVSTENEANALTVNMTISVYYDSTIAKKLKLTPPSISTPDPSGKSNPLVPVAPTNQSTENNQNNNGTADHTQTSENNQSQTTNADQPSTSKNSPNQSNEKIHQSP